MNKQKLELARRAVACDHWRWVVGTPAVAEFHGEKVGLVCIYASHQHMADFYCLDYDEVWENIHVKDQRSMGMLPDLDNPATLGCLLHMVREAWEDSGAYASPHPHFYDNGELLWRVHAGGKFLPIPSKGSHSEAHALITALEAANE